MFDRVTPATRRAFLKTATAAGAVVGLGATAAAQESEVISGERILLGGRRSGWRGVGPESIAGERNPTLRLVEGEEYELVWENQDGASHNFIVIDESDEQLVRTEIVSSSGEQQTVEFTAQAEMTEYFCGPHPVAMRGEIEVVEGDGGGGEEPAADGTETQVETVVGLDGEQTTENLAVDIDGSLYAGITGGEIRRVAPEQTQESDLSLDDTEQVAELPGETYGIEVAPDGTLFAAVHAGEETGLYRVPNEPGGSTDGTAEGDVEPLAIVGQQDEVFPNGVVYERRCDRVLFTESFEGVVYEVSPEPSDGDPENAASVWFEDDRLRTETFGANGIAIGPEHRVYVAVTETQIDGEDAGRVLRIPVDENGEATEGETFVEGPDVYGADGLAIHPLDRTLYVAAIFQDELLSVTREGEVETVLSAEDGLVQPSDVVQGTVPGQCDDVFVSNYAFDQPEESAILRWVP